jgi:hypothetical protein
MVEHIFYYFLAFNVTAIVLVVQGIVAAERRNRRERQEWERLQAAQLEKHMREAEGKQPQASVQERGYDSPQVFYDDSLKRIQQFEREINQRVLELERKR